ncbi:SDR family NAD(P)-dependent oxidoreductase [Jeotgalibacillus terrae]|uniref:SDR family NAD(P)-dependent oxidoreductase n=1 Tax=Jeotgalibacillus terrae TaxID=587735 RepID=A0ABW5ZFF8_9BACL|nr:SDR family NAD(P)-dependent oxidoreductase [Jeotgalibacillus terrae]MBM7579354.1 NAD(P)-dependent dehydrogenase (short-subunit alcohol dehydrogenase family) [Jeotgalibacillus terrae]
MAGKVICIIGAGPGIGMSAAKTFGQHGYSVALVARNEEKLQSMAEELNQQGIEAIALQGNASANESVRKAIRTTRNTFGRIDVLLYNAFTFRDQLPSEMDPIEFASDLQVDVIGALTAFQTAAAFMEEGSSILFTGGGLGVKPMKKFTSVSVGKAAIRALALAVHQELKSQDIYAGTLTINGFVREGTTFSPDLIAERLYEMSEQRKEAEWTFDKVAIT